MAARSVRCLLSNQTSYPLNLESEGLDHGIYTDPWKPPQTIPPGTIGEWRSESSGIMTGTEGHARYRVSIPTPSEYVQEFIDITWNNPYIGGNDCSLKITQDFSGEPSEKLHGSWLIETGGPPPNLKKLCDFEPEAWIGAFLFLPYLAANASSVNEPRALFGVSDHGIPGFDPGFGVAPSVPQHRERNTESSPTAWQGQWSEQSVSVRISAEGSSGVRVDLSDGGAQPPLQINASATLGEVNDLAREMLKRPTAGTAAAGTIDQGSMELRGLGGGRSGADQSNSVEQDLDRSHATLEIVTDSIAKSTIFLPHDVTLTLYDVLEGDRPVGKVIDYRRYASDGQVIREASLTFRPEVH